MKNESNPSTQRVLSSVRRLRRDGNTVLREQPLDEIAHAKWTDGQTNIFAEVVR